MKGANPKDPNSSSSSSTASAASNSDQLDSSQESELIKSAPLFQGRVSKSSHFKQNNDISQNQEPCAIPQDQEASSIAQDQESSSIAQDQGASYKDSYQLLTNLDETSNTEKPAIHHQFWNCGILSSKELKYVRKKPLKYGKYLHTNCHSCESYYSTSHPPYLQQCGISVCSVCNNKIEIECDSCNSYCDQNSTSLNKDLIHNSYLLLPAFKHLDLIKATDKILDPYIDETLYGLDQLENKIVDNKQEIQSEFKVLKSILLDFEKNFSFVKKNLKNLQTIRLMMESMNPEMSKFTTLIELSRNVDNALYFLLKAIKKSDIQIGLRVKDFSARGSNVNSLRDHLHFVALLEKYEKRQYYKFDLVEQAGYISTHKNSIKPTNKNILVIDYGSLRRDRESCGIFFHIQNEVNRTPRLIEIFFKKINFSLKEQLVLLCSGEEGPCYVGGSVVVDENGLLINSYADEGFGCDGLIQSIPDDVEYFAVPDVLDVSVTREFGCEACLRITRIVINEPANIVGRVVNKAVLNIPEGKWIIVNSGWIIPPKNL